MKRIVYIFTCFMLLISLISCNSGSLSTDADTTTYPTDNSSNDTSEIDSSSTELHSQKFPTNEKDYTIECIDGRYYMMFEHPEYYYDETVQVVDVWRDDWTELRSAILDGGLSISEKAIIVSSWEEKNGKYEIPDFYNFYGPVVPEELTVENDICWSYGAYFFVMENEGNIYMFHIATESYFQMIFERNHTNFEPKNQKELETYELRNGNKTITVDKIYRNGNLNYIYLYGEQEGRYFIVDFKVNDTVPTDEWLLSFGLELYASETE